MVPLKDDDETEIQFTFPKNTLGGRESASYDPRLPEIKIPRKARKGGSHRAAARHAEPVDTSTSHAGFRCVIREMSTNAYFKEKPDRDVEATLPQHRAS